MNSILKLRSLRRRPLSSILMSLLVLALPACHAQPPQSDTAGTSVTRDGAPVRPPFGARIELTLVGYNYTNRYIDQFDVDGQGGGNIHVSGSGSAGSGSACCVSYRAGAKARKVKIRWQTDACTYNERTSGDEKFSDTHSYFKEMEVQVDPNIPDYPRYFEVHIYPDGHAEAAITAHASRARLSLSKDSEDHSDFPRCPNDKKPSE
jgi:hypothetical protein